MRRRIEAADVVIAGRVTTVRPSEQTAETALAEQPSRPISEHDPQWWEAVIDVESVVKGELEPAPTVVLFPGSMDVLWHAVPKFRPGQEGVWFLHRQQVPPVVDAVFQRVFTVLDRDDYQEKDRLDDVKRLIEGS
jgi:hypothetical protein